MRVQVRYFASIREVLGPSEAVTLEPGTTVAALRDALIARGGPHASALARGRALRTALDQAVCDEAVELVDGAEIAFFPPVTGG
jgi:molybdopterin synthase sulfur carrier subunit